MQGFVTLLVIVAIVSAVLTPAKRRRRKKAAPLIDALFGPGKKPEEPALKGEPDEVPKPRRPLTANEQPMYFRLREALPDHIVLAQVSFSALLWAKDQRVRNTFNRKVADFVICDLTFRVVAVVELDDKSHEGREEYDQARDALLQKARLRVLRYPRIPDVDRVRNDILGLPPTGAAEAKAAPGAIVAKR